MVKMFLLIRLCLIYSNKLPEDHRHLLKSQNLRFLVLKFAGSNMRVLLYSKLYKIEKYNKLGIKVSIIKAMSNE